MNYYSRHVGDYTRDTAHLTLIEHGVYTRLLDVYYTRELPIPHDQRHRLIGARTEDEKALTDAILGEFFFQDDSSAWHQGRCDREIEAHYAKSGKAAMAAKTRWERSQKGAKPDAQSVPMECSSDANASTEHDAEHGAGMENAMQSPCIGDAKPMPEPCLGDASQSPITSNQYSPIGEIRAGAPALTLVESSEPPWWEFSEDRLAVDLVLGIRSAKGYEADAPPQDRVESMLAKLREYIPDDEAVRSTVQAFVDRAAKWRKAKREYSDPIRTIANWVGRDEARYRQIRRERERDQRGIVRSVAQVPKVGIAARAEAIMAEAGES